jgi:hypothetical protein
VITDAPLETAPTDEQKHRLTDWLDELKIICARYRLVLDTEDTETRLIDIDRGTTIGVGVSYLIEHIKGRDLITSYDCTGSILDGVWLVETNGAVAEQRHVGRVFPAPQTKDNECTCSRSPHAC